MPPFKSKSRLPKIDLGKHEDKKPGFLAFTVLPLRFSRQVLQLDVDAMQGKISTFFELETSCDLKDAALSDYYTGVVWWAKEKGFTEAQMSCFFTAAHTLLNNVKEKQMSLADNFKELKAMLVGVGKHSGGEEDAPAGGGLEYLTVPQAMDGSDYLFDTLFQHYRLHEYMFTGRRREQLIGADLEVEIPRPASVPFPPPLDEGIDAEVYEAFANAQPPSESQKTEQEATDETVERKSSVSSIDLSSDIFGKLSLQDVREVMESVATEMLGGFQNEIAVKLREEENAIIARINRVHNEAED